MDAKTIQTYDRLSQEYDNETVDFWCNFPQPFLDMFAGYAQDTILNIGSGPGRDGVLLH